MITLKCLNVVKSVETEEEAAKLEAKGFRRVAPAGGLKAPEDPKPPKNPKAAKTGT